MPSMGFAVGAGAGQGLEDVLTRMVEQAKLDQMKKIQDGQQAESVRSHMANEGIDRERIAATERDRLSRDAMTNRNYQEQSDRAMRDDGRALSEQIPGDTFLPTGDSAIKQLESGGQGSLLRMKSSLPSTSTVAASTLPGDENPAGVTVTSKELPRDIGRIKLRTQLQTEKAIADAAKVTDQGEQKRRDDNTIRHDIAMENKPSVPQVTIVPTDTGVMRVPRGGGAATPVMGADGQPVMPRSPAQILNRRGMASDVGSHFDKTEALLQEADDAGILGPLKGRTYADFMAGKIGTTGNANNDELLGELRMNLGMLASGVASLHGRAGANAGIAKDIQKKMDEGYMDPALIRGGLKSLRSWTSKYAGDGGSSGGSGKEIVYDLKGNIVK